MRRAIYPDRRGVLAAGAALLMAPTHAHAARRLPCVRLDTAMGDILIELDMVRAPISAANFLSYVEQGLFAGASFYRTVRADNDHNPARIEVIQGGLNLPDEAASSLPPIAHETTQMSGLKHRRGMISMARNAPGTASSEFFICVLDAPALDFGGARNPDGQGFAAFGRVIQGMKTVEMIHRLPTHLESEDAYTVGQILSEPVRFSSVQPHYRR